MFFLLSKLLFFLINPLIWIIALVLTGIFLKNKKKSKRAFIAAFVVFLIFSNSYLLYCFARAWDVPPVSIPANKQYSCAIVLGGFVADSKSGAYFTSAADRFIQAVKLYKQRHVSHIFVTGGSGRIINATKFRYSDWVAGELISMGVPADAIITENDSRNTLENAAYTQQLLLKNGLQPPYILVTSAFHMRRSLWTFEQAGMNVIPYPCNYFAGRSIPDIIDIWPSASVLATWPVYIKEVVGYWVYKMKR